MKEFMKKAAALLTVALITMSVSVNVFADATPRPKPGTTASSSASTSENVSDSQKNTDENSDDEKSSDDSTSKKDEKATEKPKATVMPVVTEAPAAAASNKSYTTKGGAFLWFLLSIIVNTIISFAIANRFYKLTRRSNQVQSELRALRRDIEEKFADSVGGFVESNVDITNTNDDYSMGEDGIKMTPASTVSVDDEPGDIYKQWEEQFGARYAARKAQNDEEFEDDERPVRKYQPSRDSQRMSVSERIAARKAHRDEEIEEIDEDNFEEGDSIVDKLSGVGDKAKKFLGGIFPFDDDEE